MQWGFEHAHLYTWLNSRSGHSYSESAWTALETRNKPTTYQHRVVKSFTQIMAGWKPQTAIWHSRLCHDTYHHVGIQEYLFQITFTSMKPHIPFLNAFEHLKTILKRV